MVSDEGSIYIFWVVCNFEGPFGFGCVSTVGPPPPLKPGGGGGREQCCYYCCCCVWIGFGLILV